MIIKSFLFISNGSCEVLDANRLHDMGVGMLSMKAYSWRGVCDKNVKWFIFLFIRSIAGLNGKTPSHP